MHESLGGKARTMGAPSLAALGAVLILSGCAVYGTPYGSDSDEVAVCHKNKKTLMLPRSAVDGHLGHGDTLGPCQ